MFCLIASYLFYYGEIAMTVLFIEYPKCSTCQKAKKWLQEHNVSFKDRHIVEENPSFDELRQWSATSLKPIKNFFNTSGLVYKSLHLKDKLPLMSETEQLFLLAQNDMLVKRPLVIGDDFVLIGFKEQEWQTYLFK